MIAGGTVQIRTDHLPRPVGRSDHDRCRSSPLAALALPFAATHTNPIRRANPYPTSGAQLMSPPHPLLAVALDGAGWHPAAWREPTARPGDLFRPGYWVDLVTEAERGLLDFVTFEDSLALQSTDTS